jgi:uncharacterized protein YfaS (alpha-2-macroglobulin family)
VTSYVTDFLTRAKELNYAVRQSSFNQALDRLQNYVSYAQDFSSGGESGAYALYVLAATAGADRGVALLRRHQARRFLDAAGTGSVERPAMMGDKAREVVEGGAQVDAGQGRGLTRRDYGTGIRGTALITLAAGTGIAKPRCRA